MIQNLSCEEQLGHLEVRGTAATLKRSWATTGKAGFLCTSTGRREHQ